MKQAKRKYTSKVKFHPWVGSQYNDGFNGVKTLVLGESHYEWEGKLAKNVTNEVVKDQVNGGSTQAFWTKIVTAFLNHKPSLQKKGTFWNSVAFYNFVQEAAGDGPRIRPSEGSWKRSEPAFSEVLEKLQPELIVVLGYQLWEEMPFMDATAYADVKEAPQKATWLYPHDGGDALAYGIKHPSSGFSGMEWHPHIMKAHGYAKSCAKQRKVKK